MSETPNPLEDYMYQLRHSTTHVMAQAVQELFPGTKLTIGPPVEDGFYYDFDSPHQFTPEDLPKIQKKMLQIAEGNHPFVMSTHTSEEARQFWADRGEKYKVEIIDDLKAPTVTYCSHSTFVDLCRGNHVPSTKDIRHFKVMKIAGSYWRGDEKREHLQRIYGTVWKTKDELHAYLTRMEEAKKRDHRDLGPRLGLFTLLPDTIGPGLIFWLPKGATLRRLIEDYIRDLLLQNNYQFVVTPHIARVDLWKTSGHWDFYRDNMFSPMKIDEQEYVLKPMNCPGHIEIYKHELHSYRDLPIRYTEFGTVYRYERSGVMHGLLRARGFTQDDAHIFCRMDQIATEVENILDLTATILSTFGFTEYSISLSTRPPKDSVGSDENWQKAEAALVEALKKRGLAYDIDAGGGAFYGPKIDLKIKDCLGRYWQCSTVQVDFNLPERFNVTYRGEEEGKEEQAVMVHRALLGSMERFIGILIEQYAGVFPVWLAPVQAVVMTITDRQNDYAEKMAKDLRKRGFRVETDLRNEKIGFKVRENTMKKVPFLLTVGDREMETGSVDVRRVNGERLGSISVADFTDRLNKEVVEKSAPPLAAPAVAAQPQAPTS